MRNFFWCVVWLSFSLTTYADVNSSQKQAKVERLKPTPNAWQAEGRFSVSLNQKLENGGFWLSVNWQNFQLLLTTALGFGQVFIEKQDTQLLVNQVLVKEEFNTWMYTNYGWQFPIEKLTKLLFGKHRVVDKNWGISVDSYQRIGSVKYPKIVRFTHRTQAVKIKLAIQHIVTKN